MSENLDIVLENLEVIDEKELKKKELRKLANARYYARKKGEEIPYLKPTGRPTLSGTGIKKSKKDIDRDYYMRKKEKEKL